MNTATERGLEVIVIRRDRRFDGEASLTIGHHAEAHRLGERNLRAQKRFGRAQLLGVPHDLLCAGLSGRRN